MNVLFLSEQDPRDATSWSGILLSMYTSMLNQGLRVSVVARRSGTTWCRIQRRLWPQQKSDLEEVIRRCDRLLQPGKIDVIFAPVASQLICRLSTSVPVVYFSDGTLRSIYGRRPFSEYYRLHDCGAQTASDEYRELLRMRDCQERKSLQRCTQVVYPSQWALESAVQDYGIPERKIAVIPIGANIPPHRLPRTLPEREVAKPVKLLYVGADWERKGGALILQTLDSLERRGLPAQLTIVGCRPAAALQQARIRVIPYLNKNVARDRRTFEQLLREHHFFLLPSRAEAYGIAPAEAMAYGLPALVSGVGGLSTVVRNDVSGFVMPPASSGEDYAAKIEGVVNEPGAYQKLSASAFRDYRERLDWSHFGRQIARVFEEVQGATHQ